MDASSESHIRKAKISDLDRLLQLFAQLNEAPSPPTDRHADTLAAILADERQQLLVVERSGIVVATASLAIIPNLGHGGRPYAIVENVVVDQAERGQHIGQLLMRHIIEQAQAAGCYKISLTSRNFRTDAHRFYEGLGFAATSVGFRYTLVPD